MTKRTKSHSNPGDEAQAGPAPALTGIAKAAQELSLALEDFDRQAASWSHQDELVRT
jgi:hypothetical protein